MEESVEKRARVTPKLPATEATETKALSVPDHLVPKKMTTTESKGRRSRRAGDTREKVKVWFSMKNNDF